MSDPVLYKGKLYPSAMDALRDADPHLCIAEPPVPVASWQMYVDELEPRWHCDWREEIERRAAAAKAHAARDAWWIRGRLAYQFAELRSSLGLDRAPAAMVNVR